MNAKYSSALEKYYSMEYSQVKGFEMNSIIKTLEKSKESDFTPIKKIP